MQATALTAPSLQVLYRLDGSADAAERTIPLSGYRDSKPVRVGNAAVEQHQLDLYGDLLETTWLYAKGNHTLKRRYAAWRASVARSTVSRFAKMVGSSGSCGRQDTADAALRGWTSAVPSA